MKQHFTDERTGISYTLQGDYYLPDLARMNNICSRDTEIVNSELICTDSHPFSQKDYPASLSDNIPKVFWKYFDLYRRRQITLQEYVNKTGLDECEIVHYLRLIKKDVREKLIKNC